VIHLHHAGNKRLPELATFVLCGAAGVLQFTLFVQPSGGAVDDDVGGVLARALGRAALDALPDGAAAVFFLGITLVIAHIRAGGGGGAVHKKIALGAAAALVSQIAIAALYVNKYDPQTPPPPPSVFLHPRSLSLCLPVGRNPGKHVKFAHS
jgi:hypothetical protein